ncbi:SDR family NAD(P)-dependent oxidoreductase [Burkholderia sp. SR8]
MESFAGKVAVVTGAATGIGRQAALCFAQAGARVAVLDTVVAAAEDTAHAIAQLGANAIVLRTDVSRADAVRTAIDTAVATFGRLDIAFNNAGIAPRGAPVAEFDEDEWTARSR